MSESSPHITPFLPPDPLPYSHRQKKPEESQKAAPKPLKAQKAKLNIQEEMSDRKKGKDNMNLVVVGECFFSDYISLIFLFQLKTAWCDLPSSSLGHVDAGKSTLMGHLLFLLGEVSDKVMNKYERESQKIGKSSFKFAWALDETAEERER